MVLLKVCKRNFRCPNAFTLYFFAIDHIILKGKTVRPPKYLKFSHTQPFPKALIAQINQSHIKYLPPLHQQMYWGGGGEGVKHPCPPPLSP